MKLNTLYHLGLPAWAYPGWRDSYLLGKPSQLSQYAKVFNSVEGNTSSYGKFEILF